MKEKMSRWGVGPTFAFLSIGYGVIVLAISRHFYPTFQIPLLPKWLLSGLGVVLMLIGIPFFIFSVKTVMNVLSEAEEAFERRYELKSLGYDLDRVAARVAEIYEMEIGEIYLKGKQRERVKARSLFCYWAVLELGFSLTELARRLDISLPAVRYSAERGETIAHINHYQLIN